MATPSKTQAQSIIALASLASNSVSISSALDVSTKFAGTWLIHFGRRATSALTEGLEFRIEASAKSSGDGFWYPVAAFKTKIAAVTSEAVNGTCNSGQKVIAMTSTTGMTVGDIVYIDNTTIANSEWGRIAVVTSNTSITLEDNLNNAQTGSIVFPSGEMYAAQIDLLAIGRVRVVANGDNTGQATAIEVWAVTCDSIS